MKEFYIDGDLALVYELAGGKVVAFYSQDVEQLNKFLDEVNHPKNEYFVLDGGEVVLDYIEDV